MGRNSFLASDTKPTASLQLNCSTHGGYLSRRQTPSCTHIYTLQTACEKKREILLTKGKVEDSWRTGKRLQDLVGEFRGWKGGGEAEWPRKREEKEEKRRRKGGGGKLFLLPPLQVSWQTCGQRRRKEEEEDGKRRPDRWFFRGWRTRGCKAKKVGWAKKVRKESEQLSSVS